LSRPHYLVRPSGAVRLVCARLGLEDDAQRLEPVRLPWGLSMLVSPAEDIGRSIEHTGVFDPDLTEAVHRLLDSGERAVDVGANFAYVTSLMVARAGALGEIYAYEAHPDVFRVLEMNASLWSSGGDSVTLHLAQLAVADCPGVGALEVPPSFGRNMGLARLATDAGVEGEHRQAVDVACLDDLLPDQRVHLVKLDIEGHEAAALRGAARMLSEGRVRDVIIEDHDRYPTEAMALLEDHGLRVFSIDRTFLGPRLRPPEEGFGRPAWPGPNYLATSEPARALARFAPRGFRSFATIGRPGRSLRAPALKRHVGQA
jgi:FkbM family methyltransferase